MFEVTNTQMINSNLVAHMGRMVRGSLKEDDLATCEVNPDLRLRYIALRAVLLLL